MEIVSGIQNALRSMRLVDFSVFRNARFVFGKHLNVVVGENGTGKTHVLKAAYAGVAAAAALQEGHPGPVEPVIRRSLSDKLMGVFKPDQLGRLVRRAPGSKTCTLEHCFEGGVCFQAAISRRAKTDVALARIGKLDPAIVTSKRPVYIPTRELLTIYPGFVSLYETTHLPFEETWRDTCILLGAPLARGPREPAIRKLLAPLEASMNGTIELDRGGRFYLREKAAGRMEMHLVAEGIRKLAMIARLIATGALLDSGYLFWDEPEANLNPKLIKSVARAILEIAANGVQVFVATHSLFLLREIDLLQQTEPFLALDNRFFGLDRNAKGVQLKSGKSIDEIGGIAALDEELMQSDRYVAAHS